MPMALKIDESTAAKKVADNFRIAALRREMQRRGAHKRIGYEQVGARGEQFAQACDIATRRRCMERRERFAMVLHDARRAAHSSSSL